MILFYIGFIIFMTPIAAIVLYSDNCGYKKFSKCLLAAFILTVIASALNYVSKII